MTAHLSTESAFPDYWEEALFYLSERDPVMKRLIERYRHIEFTAHESVIASILRAIVGQQISNKAAATLWGRLCLLKHGRWDSFIVVTPTSTLRGLGFNPRKIAAMKEVAWRFVCGQWTEEDDFGVRQALVNLYFSDENVISVGRSGAKSRVKLLANVWAPYRTVATWFLWRSLENTPLEKESE